MQKQLDGLMISLLVEELNNNLAGIKIDKVFSPTPDSVAIYPVGNLPYLFISYAKNAERIHIRNTHLENPKIPPAFCMILRKYLCGGTFISFKQVGLDKIIEIEFESWNDYDDTQHRKLVVEMIPNRGNIFLLDQEGYILDCAIKNANAKRNLVSHSTYEPLSSQGKLDFFSCTKDQFKASLTRQAIKSCDEEQSIAYLISLIISGIGKSTADSVVFGADLDIDCVIKHEDLSNDLLDSLWLSFSNHRELFIKRSLDIEIGYNVDADVISLFGLKPYIDKGLIERSKAFESISQMLDSFFGKKEQGIVLKTEKAKLYKTVKKLLDRTTKKLVIQKEELVATKDADKYKNMGDLIINNMHVFTTPLNLMQKNSRKMVEFDLIDYFDSNLATRKVELDPSMSVSLNAKMHFNKYNKAMRAKLSIAENIEKTSSDISYFESIADSLEKASTMKEIGEIQSELVALGYIRSRQKKNSGKKSTPLPVKYAFKSAQGTKYEIYVGKNNLQNDHLTFKLARQNDLWFHVKEIAGSHVVIKNDAKSELEDDVIQAAATLAAYYSKGRLSSKVPVDYTEKRYVKKPNLAKPGFVIYEKQNTLYVTPSIENMKLLFGSNPVEDN